MTSGASALADELFTVRDLLRYAVSRFTTGGIAYGHGTAEAFDEAAFLVLEGLKLPVDRLEPFLDARLTRAEREAILGLIDARVTTRKPAAYLLGVAYLKGLRFRIDERAIVPRSFIADVLLDETVVGGEDAPILDPDGVESVLDLCTGSGALAVLAALRFPFARVDAVELSGDAAALARLNVAEHGLGERISILEGDLFAPVAGRRYDVVVTNPPYVRRAAVAAFPREWAAEPAMAHLGGEDGLDVVRRILDAAADHLTDEGVLICEIGAERATLEAERPDLPFLWLDTELSRGEVFLLRAGELA